MIPRALLFFAALALASGGCSTAGRPPRDLTHPPSFGGLCPPDADATIRAAQTAVLDLEAQLAQARHDLDYIRLSHRQFDLQNVLMQLQANNDRVQSAAVQDEMRKLDAYRDTSDRRLEYSKQWVDALRSGDCWAAQKDQDNLNDLR